MVEGLRRGDVVVMSGGIIGKVVKATPADDPEVLIEIADNVEVRVLKSSLAEVRAKTQPAGKD
jgi:preprotein translocase subunit YajC